MKHPHLCPMELLVFIFSPNMAPMRSPDTPPCISYSVWHREGEENPKLSSNFGFVLWRRPSLGGLPDNYAVKLQQ